MPLVTKNSINSNVIKQPTEPLNWTEGDVWVQTGTKNSYINVGGEPRLMRRSIGELVAHG